MTSDPDAFKHLMDRHRVLEKENELLIERAEEISLLGLIAEQIETESSPSELLLSALERVCILKAMSYGVCLGGKGPGLAVEAAFHGRRQEEIPGVDHFQIRDPDAWPPARAMVLDPRQFEQIFERMEIGGPGLRPMALALLPMKVKADRGCCLLFVDESRNAQELDRSLPLLERVADLVKAQLRNLVLIADLQGMTQELDRKVEERTRQLSRSEERYRILFEHVPDGILLVDADHEGHFGRIENANDVAAALHGYPIEELRRMDLESLTAPEFGPRLESFEARVWRLQHGETVREELLHRRKDGSIFPVEAIGTLLRVQDHQFLLGFYRDLTARKQAEQALLEAQRAESLGILAGGIAHDFNNLLTAVIGQTSLAIDRPGTAGAGRKHLEKALEAAEKAANLTQQMLAYSGRGKRTALALSVNRLIRENLGILDAGIPKTVRIELDLQAGLPLVIADPNQLQQVIMNLVINGIEAIGEAAGCINLRTRSVQLGQAVGTSLAPGEYISIEVEDSGCGMTGAVRSHIFEPFFTTNPKGHGLGLSAVQGIIRGHMGVLTVESAEGSGTTFRILLPADDLAQPMTEPRVLCAGPAEPKVVLAIDDETCLLEVVEDCLQAAGHQVLLASSGEDGIELACTSKGRIDVVLLDLSMPGLSSMETFKRIREMDPEVPVVLTSGFAEEEAMAKFKGLDLAGFLQKPYRADTLIALVESMGNKG